MEKIKIFTFMICLAFLSTTMSNVSAQTDNEEEINLLGTSQVIHNVGKEFDKNGEGVDVEYVLEGTLLSNVDINQQDNTITFYYDSKGIDEDVLMIKLPEFLIEDPKYVMVDGVKIPEAIQSLRNGVWTYYLPLYKENHSITFIGKKVISGDSLGGGCLIATATYGSELAPQVQQLREIRDKKLIQTNSGFLFIKGFNEIYYSFSPSVADWERSNLLFKEAVKVAITPMISSLSILNNVDIGTDSEVLAYGTSVILLNIGMYLGVPVTIIIGIKNRKQVKKSKII